MAVCKQCGSQIGDQDVFCPNCGADQQNDNQQNDNQQPWQVQYSNAQLYNPQNSVVEDKGGFLWGLLGCCVPIAGLVLFLVWKDTKPKTAKAAGTGALVGVIMVVLYYIIIVVIGAAVGVGTAALSLF